MKKRITEKESQKEDTGKALKHNGLVALNGKTQNWILKKYYPAEINGIFTCLRPTAKY